MNIQHEILRTLANASGHPLMEDVIQAQVESRLRPRPTNAEFDDAMLNLRTRGFIAVKENELDPEQPFWLLDERGEAYIIKAKL